MGALKSNVVVLPPNGMLYGICQWSRPFSTSKYAFCPSLMTSYSPKNGSENHICGRRKQPRTQEVNTPIPITQSQSLSTSCEWGNLWRSPTPTTGNYSSEPLGIVCRKVVDNTCIGMSIRRADDTSLPAGQILSRCSWTTLRREWCDKEEQLRTILTDQILTIVGHTGWLAYFHFSQYSPPT